MNAVFRWRKTAAEMAAMLHIICNVFATKKSQFHVLEMVTGGLKPHFAQGDCRPSQRIKIFSEQLMNMLI